MQLPELGYLKNVSESVLEALRLAIKLSGENKFDAVSKECRRVSGALHMSKFEGAARVMDDAFEYSLLAAKGATDERAGKPSDVLTNVFSATKQYVLDALADAPDVPMKLWESYRFVRAGRKMGAHPSQLFFPRIEGGWNAVNSNRAPNAEAFLAARNKLSSELMKWIQNPAEVESLNKVYKIISDLIAVAPLSSSHVGFLSSALAAIDTVRVKEKPDAFDKLVLSRVDAELKILAEGKNTPVEEGWRYLLYVVAFGSAETEIAKDVKRRHSLVEYSDTIRQEATRQGKTLDDVSLKPIKEALANIKDAWAKVSAGGSISEMEKTAKIMAERLPAFDHPSVKRLGDALLQLTHGIRVKQITLNSKLSDEIASMLMLIEQAVEAKGRVSVQFETRTLSQIKRTLMAVKNDEAGLALMPDTEVDEESKQRSKKLIRQQVLTEAQAELKAAEEVLDTWLKIEDETAEDVIESAQPLKRLVHVLKMTQLPEASKVLENILNVLQNMINKPKIQLSESDCSFVSENLASLGLYIDAEINEQDDAIRFLKLDEIIVSSEKLLTKKEEVLNEIASFDIESVKPNVTGESVEQSIPETMKKDSLIEIQKLDLHKDHVAPKQVLVLEGDVDRIEDESMLEIFIEDFAEQMNTLKEGSLKLSKDPGSKAALGDIRRAFHTLKGSGRMLSGLVRMPNVAEVIENFLKKWISDDKKATPQLLNSIEDAINVFDGWKTELEQENKVTVKAEDLVKQFSFESYEEYRSETEEEKVAKVVVAEKAIEEPVNVFIGTMVMSNEIYKMYLVEAGEQIQTIESEWLQTKASAKREVTKNLMRACHTLGSTSKTVQLTSLAEVGYLLERWTEKKMDGGGWIGNKESSDIDSLIDLTKKMYSAVANKEEASINEEILGAVEAWLVKSADKSENVVAKSPAWANEKAISVDGIKKVRDKLEQEIAKTRSHLGEMESMLMLLNIEIDNGEQND